MTRRDLRTAEREWRNTPNRSATSARRPVRQPLTIGRMLNMLLRWL